MLARARMIRMCASKHPRAQNRRSMHKLAHALVNVRKCTQARACVRKRVPMQRAPSSSQAREFVLCIISCGGAGKTMFQSKPCSSPTSTKESELHVMQWRWGTSIIIWTGTYIDRFHYAAWSRSVEPDCRLVVTRVFVASVDRPMQHTSLLPCLRAIADFPILAPVKSCLRISSFAVPHVYIYICKI
jgi:hypothetical protein